MYHSLHNSMRHAMDDLWRRRVVFDSSYFMLPEATGDSEADRIHPTEEEETNRVSAADNDDDAKSSTNDPLGYYGADGVVGNNDSAEEADGEEVVCSNKFDLNGVRSSVFVGGLGCCEDCDEAGLGINDHKKRASDHEYTHGPHRMTETPMRTKTTSSSSSPSCVGSEVVNSYPKQQLKGCTAKRKKAMTEMEKNRLFWDTCLAS